MITAISLRNVIILPIASYCLTRPAVWRAWIYLEAVTVEERDI
jgi:hypothetical protein